MITGEFKTISFHNIVLTDDWNYASLLGPSSAIDSSDPIPTTGMLQPPVVKEIENQKGQYQILCGHIRFKSFQKYFPDEKSIPLLVLPATISHRELLQFVLCDKHISGKFNAVEKSLFLHLCCKHLSKEEVITYFLPQLDEKPQPYIFEKLLSLTRLELEMQKGIHSGKLSEKMAYELLTFSENDRNTLHNLFTELELGGGKQKRLLSLCKNLASRKNISISELLTESEYQHILSHQEMNTPQKGASLLNLLQKQLFPESTQAEDLFRKRVLRMELPANCTIAHSPAFEKDEVSLTIQLKDMEQLEKQMESIKKILS